VSGVTPDTTHDYFRYLSRRPGRFFHPAAVVGVQNPLADANVNGTLNPLFAEQERGGLIGEVTPSGGDHGMVAEHLQASLTYRL